MHRITRLIGLAGAIAGLVASLTVGTVAAAGSPSVGHVYVNNNTTGRNTIAGFDRHADGSLTPSAGSPFDAGGAGPGAPFGSAGGLQRTPDCGYLLATEANVFRTAGAGGLTLRFERTNAGAQASGAVIRFPRFRAIRADLEFAPGPGRPGSASTRPGDLAPAAIVRVAEAGREHRDLEVRDGAVEVGPVGVGLRVAV